MLDWHPLGAVLYRKWQVYDMVWSEIALENFVVCGAPYGGPIALTPMKKSAKTEDATSKSRLMIFTSAGKPLANVELDAGEVAGLGWTYQEHLCVVLENGNFNYTLISVKAISLSLSMPNCV